MSMDSYDQLWGGLVESFSFSPSDFTIVARVVVVDDAVEHRYDLALGEVTEFQFKNDGPAHWSAVELTSFQVDRDKSGAGNRVLMEFWNGIAVARLTCKSITVVPA